MQLYVDIIALDKQCLFNHEYQQQVYCITQEGDCQ